MACCLAHFPTLLYAVNNFDGRYVSNQLYPIHRVSRIFCCGENDFVDHCFHGISALRQEYDATELMRRDGPFPSLGKILLDQGSADNFLTGGRARPIQQVFVEIVFLSVLLSLVVWR